LQLYFVIVSVIAGNNLITSALPLDCFDALVSSVWEYWQVSTVNRGIRLCWNMGTWLTLKVEN